MTIVESIIAIVSGVLTISVLGALVIIGIFGINAEDDNDDEK